MDCLLCDLVFRGWSKLSCFFIRAGNHLVLVWAWIFSWLFCGCQNLTWFQCVEWNLAWFQCRDGIDLVVVWVVRIDLISVRESALSWSFCWGRKYLFFTVWMEVNLVLLSTHRNWLKFKAGIEIDLILALSRKWTWFLCRGSNRGMFFCWSSTQTWSQCGWSSRDFR